MSKRNLLLKGHVINMWQDLEDFSKRLNRKLCPDSELKLPRRPKDLPLVIIRRNNEGAIDHSYNINCNELKND